MCRGTNLNDFPQRKYYILICLLGVLVALDQVTKLYVHTQFKLHESLPVIADIFNITYVRNFGAAFGVMAKLPDNFRTLFFLSIAPIACLIILIILKSVNNRDTKQILALSAIFSGAVGNYIDRIQFGYVIDFLDFGYKSFSWPAFNVADMAIVIGVFYLLYTMLKEQKHKTS